MRYINPRFTLHYITIHLQPMHVAVADLWGPSVEFRLTLLVPFISVQNNVRRIMLNSQNAVLPSFRRHRCTTCGFGGLHRHGFSCVTRNAGAPEQISKVDPSLPFLYHPLWNFNRLAPDNVLLYIGWWSDVTQSVVWYDRHFVGITRHSAFS